jgi:flagellar hook assembly protein FlgD/chitodextrinase
VAEGKKLGFSGSDFEIGAKYHAHRAKQMFRIWEDVFGGNERLVKVIGGFHYGGAHYANLILSHENVYQEADAYATAPYFAYDYGGSKAEWVKITSPTEIFADMALEVEQSNKMTKEVADKVSSFGLDTVAYEGGQHMAPIFYWQTGTFYQNDDVLVNKLAWLNRQPQMYDMYQKHFDGWKAAGGRLNVTFSSVTDYGRYGSFGLLEYADQAYDKAYKYRSTLDWSKSHPRWWGQVEVGAPGEAEAVYASPSELKIIRTNKTGLAVGWAPPVPRLGTVIVQQVKQYEIFVDGLSVGTVAADVTQFEWSGLKPNLAYQIGVKAHYADGGMSGQVYTNGRTRPDLQTPRTPTGLSANAVEMDRFGLTWNASSDDVALAGYEIFLNGAKVGTTNQLTYEISGLVAATPYNVSVRAMDEAGNRSGLSIRLLVRTAVDTLAPSTPGQLYAMNVNSRSVSLYWTPSVDNGKMSGYEVFVGGQLLTTVRDTQYTVGNLVSAKGYSFTVRAVDLAGNRSSFSHLLNQTTTADLVAPSTPNGLRMLRARVSVGELDLVWERSHDEDVVAHYLVYRNGQYLMKTTQPRAVVSGLVAGQTYSFTLRAVDASGNQSVESTSVLASLTELQLLKVVNSHTSGATVVQYRLAKDSYVTVRLFDQDNKYVSTPLAKTWLKSGLRMVTIKYTGLSDGRYRYEIEAEHAVVERLQGTVLLDRQRPMINNMTSSNSVTNESHRRITTVTFSLSERAKIRAQVLDGKGQIVFILADNVVMRSGTNQLRWNGINHAGRIVEDGLYTLKLTAVDDGGLSSVAVSVQVRVDTMTPTMSGWKTSNAKLKVKGDNRFVVTFMLSEDATVEAKLFNCDNQFLMNLPAGTMKRGLNSISWNGRGKEGKYVVNGNYYVQVKAVDGSNKSSGNMKLEIATEVEF